MQACGLGNGADGGQSPLGGLRGYRQGGRTLGRNRNKSPSGSGGVGPVQRAHLLFLSEPAALPRMRVVSPCGWFCISPGLQEMKRRKGENFSLRTYGADQTHPAGAPGQNKPALLALSSVCDKTLSWTPFDWEGGTRREHSRNPFFSAAPHSVAYIHLTDLIGLLLCVGERERERPLCVLWRRLMGLGPVFVVIGGAMDPILCLLPLDIS